MSSRTDSTLHSLQQLSLTIGTSLSLSRESAAFLDWLETFATPRMVALFVRDTSSHMLEFIAGRGPAPTQPEPLPVGYNPWEWLRTHQVPLPPEEAAPRYVLPLTSEGQVIGIVCLLLPAPLDEHAMQVLDIACALLGSTLRNIQRYQSIEKLVEERTAELRASEERYRAISETISDFAYAVLVTPEGRIRPEWITESFFRVSGYTPEEIAALDGWLPLLVEEDRPTGLKRRERILRGETNIAEFRIRYKDGSIHWLRDYSVPVWDAEQGRVVRVYGAAQDITSRKAAQQALERRTAEANALLETAHTIASLDLEHVLQTIVRRARDLFQSDGSRIHLLEPDGKTLRCAVVLHEHAEAMRKTLVPLGEGFTGRVAQSGQARIIADSEAEGGGLHVPGTPEISESMMLAPLKRGERVIGVMTVTRSGARRPFSPHDLHFLQAFASQAAIAIANAQLFEKRTQFARQMQALSDLGHALLGVREAERACALVGETLLEIQPQVLAVQVFQPVPAQDDLHPLYLHGNPPEPSVQSTLPRQALEKRQVLQGEGRLCLPLLYGEKALGVMCLRTEVPLPEEAQVPLRVCANLLAAALENLHLFQEVRHQLQHMQALHMITRSINASVDMNVMLRVILKQITMHLQADAAAVFLLEEYTSPLVCRALEYPQGAPLLAENLQLHLHYPTIQEAILEQKLATISDREYIARALSPADWVAQQGWRQAQVIPLVAKGRTRGVLLLLFSALHPDTPEEADFLRGAARQTALGIEHALLFEKLQITSMQLSISQDQVLEHLALLIEAHQHEPPGSTQHMADLACRVAEAMGIRGEQIEYLRRGVLLHDVGMLLVPEVAAYKAAPLTEAEWELVRQHPERGYAFLQSLAFLQPALEVIRYHHERWNGSGYPHGLSGAEIPVLARIAAVTDVWCALTSRRPWRPALPAREAARHLLAMAGKALDPQATGTLLDILRP